MKQIIKGLKISLLVILLGGFCTTVRVNAQSPADDPGIGGPGSPSVGVGGDGGPLVPFDGGMSLMFAASGIGYAVKKVKNKKMK